MKKIIAICILLFLVSADSAVVASHSDLDSRVKELEERMSSINPDFALETQIS